jgi:hypothetical protein
MSASAAHPARGPPVAGLETRSALRTERGRVSATSAARPPTQKDTINPCRV